MKVKIDYSIIPFSFAALFRQFSALHLHMNAITVSELSEAWGSFSTTSSNVYSIMKF